MVENQKLCGDPGEVSGKISLPFGKMRNVPEHQLDITTYSVPFVHFLRRTVARHNKVAETAIDELVHDDFAPNTEMAVDDRPQPPFEGVSTRREELPVQKRFAGLEETNLKCASRRLVHDFFQERKASCTSRSGICVTKASGATGTPQVATTIRVDIDNGGVVVNTI
jgi:hypothetical protein